MAGSDVQRKNMVESQVRPSDVTDRRILRAMLDIPREAFLPPNKCDVAYADTEVTVSAAGRRALMAPRTFAKLLQLAAPEQSETVLDVGAGGGYSTAVIARLAGRVTALESDATLAAATQSALEAAKVTNASIVTGDLSKGHAASGPFDLIILEGAVPEAPEALIGQLKDGGRLVTFINRGLLSEAVVIRRSATGLSEAQGFTAGVPKLPGFERAESFVL